MIKPLGAKPLVLFKVKSKPSTKAKFWVTTQDLKVEVFGTHFNVNTRNKKTDVLLDEGSISLLLENGNSTKMQPGEIVTYSKESDKIVHNKVNSKIKLKKIYKRILPFFFFLKT